MPKNKKPHRENQEFRFFVFFVFLPPPLPAALPPGQNTKKPIKHTKKPGPQVFCFFGVLICNRLVNKYANDPTRQNEKDKDFGDNMAFFGKWLFFLTFFFAFSYIIYKIVEGTPWQSHLHDWMDLIIRWLHIIFGIAWIGASFYFVFLEFYQIK